jgi:hypothetical protein
MITVEKDMSDHRQFSLQNDHQIKVNLIIENFSCKIITIIERYIGSLTLFIAK